MTSTLSSGNSPAPTPEKQNIYLMIRDRIINWHYPPGYHLGEKTLCDEFDVSRVPIREALRALTAEGFVDKVPNLGCYVKQLDVKETEELYDLRLALELHVGETLMRTPPSDEWISGQRSYWQTLLDAKPEQTSDVSAFVKADSEFHIGLAQAGGNQRILQLIEDLNERLRFVRLSVATNPERLQETSREHLAILDAIDAKDCQAVRAAIRKNITHSSDRVELAISRALLAAHTKKR